MPAFHKRSQIRTKSGNVSRVGLAKGYVMTYRSAPGPYVTLRQSSRYPKVFVCTMHTPYGDETVSSTRVQTCREAFREFCRQLDRAFPSSTVATQRVTVS